MSFRFINHFVLPLLFSLLSGTDIGTANFRQGQIVGVPSLVEVRHKRQSFSRYICGTPPFLFHSDIPCSFWAICLNHGFATNLPCADTQNCLQYNPRTECVQGTCCTLPNVQKMPLDISSTISQLTSDASVSPLSSNSSIRSTPFVFAVFCFSLSLCAAKMIHF